MEFTPRKDGHGKRRAQAPALAGSPAPVTPQLVGAPLGGQDALTPLTHAQQWDAPLCSTPRRSCRFDTGGLSQGQVQQDLTSAFQTPQKDAGPGCAAPVQSAIAVDPWSPAPRSFSFGRSGGLKRRCLNNELNTCSPASPGGATATEAPPCALPSVAKRSGCVEFGALVEAGMAKRGVPELGEEEECEPCVMRRPAGDVLPLRSLLAALQAGRAPAAPTPSAPAVKVASFGSMVAAGMRAKAGPGSRLDQLLQTLGSGPRGHAGGEESSDEEDEPQLCVMRKPAGSCLPAISMMAGA
eukprot:jgi/Tetstr1/461060/TSEL_006207.t1